MVSRHNVLHVCALVGALSLALVAPFLLTFRPPVVAEAGGLPLDLVPLLLTVDWALGRLRAATNVLADLAVSVAIDSREPASS
jgi:Na+/H+-dicarboxylate symporter